KTLAWRDCSRLTVNAVRRASSKRVSPVWFSKSVMRTESRELKENAGLPYKSQKPSPLNRVRTATAPSTHLFDRLSGPRIASEAAGSAEETGANAGARICFTSAIKR